MFAIKNVQLSDDRLNEHFNSEYTRRMLSSMNLSDDQIDQLVNGCFALEDSEVINEAANLFNIAKRENRKVMVCGDYDADGICSTSMMVDLCQRLGFTTGFYIPDRLKEGYGTKESTISAALEKGYDFFILVDNGVSTHDVNKKIRESGSLLLIIDHHVISQPVQADVLLHPDVLPDVYQGMCTSGLVYLICVALGMENDKMIQLAGVATIGDMMPLWNYNRKLVIDALKALNHAPLLQFSALLDKSTHEYDEGLIAFQIVPKLNVVGRLADRANVNQIVRYMLSDQKEEILRVSASIKELNQIRRQLSAQMYDFAKEQISDEKLLIITHPDFHEGLVGITAGQISKETGKPTIVLAQKEDSFKGSGRSSSINLHQLLSEGQEHLLHFGGHAQAAGLEVGNVQFEDFSKFMISGVNELMEHLEDDVVEVLRIDPSMLHLSAIDEFEKCAPFGQGFERPLVFLENLRVIKPMHNNNRNFSKWLVSLKNEDAEVVLFSDIDDSIRSAEALNVIATVTISTFLGRRKISLMAQKVVKSHGNKF
jgi:single-stranded-DNA-specific exonuclease